jgi:two-component system LytT family response regulator
MIKAVIIDDEPLARSIIKEYLSDNVTIDVVAECGDGFEGLKAINHHKPDLVFLDIQMPKITGFEMLELIEEPPAIIFTTAFDEYAIKAFETNAIDYLLKPFDKSRFDKAIEKWINGSKSAPEKWLEPMVIAKPEIQGRVVVKTNQGIKIIQVSDIIYLEAFDDYVKINTKEAVFLKKNTLTYYENALSQNDFIRVHRSYLLAINQITRIENSEKDTHRALLKSGAKIPLSRSGYVKLKGVLGV